MTNGQKLFLAIKALHREVRELRADLHAGRSVPGPPPISVDDELIEALREWNSGEFCSADVIAAATPERQRLREALELCGLVTAKRVGWHLRRLARKPGAGVIVVRSSRRGNRFRCINRMFANVATHAV